MLRGMRLFRICRNRLKPTMLPSFFSTTSAVENDVNNNVPPVCRLDMRVGKILNAEKHPAADALYIEDIDVGEEIPRKVVSGLAGKIPLEEMKDQLVVLLCNLKPTNLRGIKSFAMVLCASSENDGVVQLVKPPSTARIGEIVKIDTFPDPIPDKVLNPKHKVWESVMPDMKTDDNGTACYKGSKFMTSAGPCSVDSLKGAQIR